MIAGSIGPGLTAIALFAMTGAPALAQEEAATPAPTISGVPAPAAPDGDAAATDAQISWPVVCGAAGDSSCVTLQALGVAETGERVLTVMVQSDGADGENVILQLPHGILFPAGVQIQVDDGAVVQAWLTTSDPSGAFAGVTMTPDLAASLQAGEALNVSFTSVDGELMTFPVPLEGFADSYAARRAGTPTQ